MSNPFIGEITLFGGNFAPRGWALCDGQLLAINSNQALFSLLGTTYGGDGRTTFALPDLRGRGPLHFGTGPGLSPRNLGQRAGAEEHRLITNELPAHGHAFAPGCRGEKGDELSPTGRYLAEPAPNDAPKAFAAASNAAMGSGTTANSGGDQDHNNMQPWLAVNYIIALIGTFPSRS